MPTRTQAPLSMGLALALAMTIASCAQDNPRLIEQAPNTEHIPSAGKMMAAKKAREDGLDRAALAYYKQAAFWADKFGQFNVGLMYLKGMGVEQDLPRGWAWLELSAERGYPQLAEPADKIRRALNERQLQEGRRILEEELLPTYGDDVAVERAARKMKRERRQATGSRTGAQSVLGRLTVIDGNITQSGEDYYAAEKWDFETIVEAERQYLFNLATGNVRLRDFRTLDDERGNGEGDAEENGEP